MTKKPFGWAMATMLLGACVPAPPRSPEANERLIGAYLPAEPSTEPAAN